MGWREMLAAEEAKARDHRLDYVQKRGPLVWPEHKGGPRPAPTEVSREPIPAELDPEGYGGDLVTMSDGSTHHVWLEFDRGTERYEVQSLVLTEAKPVTP